MQSANIPQGPMNPNGYAEEEVLRELRAIDGTRSVEYRYELLDGDLNFKRDMDEVLSGSIQFSYISEIKRTASFTVRGGENIDYLHDHIRPFFRLKMPPRWTVPSKETSRSWDNSWDGASGGEAVTVVNSGYTGDPIDSANLTPGMVYSRTRRIKSSASVRLGTSDGSFASHGFSTQESPVDPAQDLLVRGWFYKDDNTHFIVNVSGNVGFQLGVSGGDTCTFNGQSSTVTSNVSDFEGKWVRYEIEVSRGTTDVVYRFYWTDPLTLTEDNAADYVVNETLGSPFSLSAVSVQFDYIGSSSPSTDGMYVDLGPQEFGDLIYNPSRPDPTENDYVEWCLGTFLMVAPTRSSDENDVVTREIEAFDRSQIFIDEKLTNRVTVPKGYSYYQLLKDLLQDYPHYIEPTNWVVGRNREFDVGMSIKEVVDRIADSINYHSLRVDEWGTVVVDTYVSPGDRTPEFHYTDDEVSIMSPDVSVEFDAFNIPNVWIVSLNEADEDPVHVKLENHDPANPFSIPRRGRRIVDYREQEEGFDRASLMRKAKRIQYEANRVFENIEFTTINNPLHSANDCYTMDYGVLNVNNKYTEISWEMELSEGSLMSHTCRRNVDLDPELFDGFVDGALTVNGSFSASNMKWGRVTIAAHKPNKPTSVKVTGMNLGGSGMVHVFVTPHTTVPGTTVMGAGVKDRSANGFTLWSYRTNATSNSYWWLAVRDI